MLFSDFINCVIGLFWAVLYTLKVLVSSLEGNGGGKGDTDE